MQKTEKLYIVSEEALSLVLKKTICAKELLEMGKAKNISEAVLSAGISRGAFYKYRDLIKPFYNMRSEKNSHF